MPIEKIGEELKKFDDHHFDTHFQDVNHCLNVWGKWCSKVKEKETEEHEAKNSQFQSGQQKAVPVHKISKVKNEDAR
ncbi:MAG: hypothetical protein K0R51_3463 [Cytophagaceae bacterium]|nr:hypothetical protein [Cytophagaceae bacterium]